MLWHRFLPDPASEPPIQLSARPQGPRLSQPGRLVRESQRQFQDILASASFGDNPSEGNPSAARRESADHSRGIVDTAAACSCRALDNRVASFADTLVEIPSEPAVGIESAAC